MRKVRARDAHAIHKRSAKTKEERNSKEGRQSERAMREWKLEGDVVTSFSTSATRTENVGRVRSRAYGGKGSGGEGVVVGQGVGRTIIPPRSGEGKGHGDARCRKAARKSGTDEETSEEEVEEEEEKEKEERVPRRRDGGEEKERGVRRGELPTTRSPSIPRAGTADTCLRHYTRTVL